MPEEDFFANRLSLWITSKSAAACLPLAILDLSFGTIGRRVNRHSDRRRNALRAFRTAMGCCETGDRPAPGSPINWPPYDFRLLRSRERAERSMLIASNGDASVPSGGTAGEGE